jgi:hypothetical protein
MSENKGRGMKGRSYDALTSVGTSSAGITGTTGNLNTGTRDGGIGMPSPGDSGYRAGNRQSADADDGDTTPALGRGTRARPADKPAEKRQGSEGNRSGASRQGGQGEQNAQGGLGHSLDQDVMGKEQ